MSNMSIWRVRATSGGWSNRTGIPAVAFISSEHGRAKGFARKGFTAKFEYWIRQLGNPPSRKFPGREGWTVEVPENLNDQVGRDGDTVYLVSVKEPGNGVETILQFRDGVHESLVHELREKLTTGEEEDHGEEVR